MPVNQYLKFILILFYYCTILLLYYFTIVLQKVNKKILQIKKWLLTINFKTFNINGIDLKIFLVIENNFWHKEKPPRTPILDSYIILICVRMCIYII